MKTERSYTIAITAQEKVQPTESDICGALADLVRKKIEESGDKRKTVSTFDVEVVSHHPQM